MSNPFDAVEKMAAEAKQVPKTPEKPEDFLTKKEVLSRVDQVAAEVGIKAPKQKLDPNKELEKLIEQYGKKPAGALPIIDAERMLLGKQKETLVAENPAPERPTTLPESTEAEEVRPNIAPTERSTTSPDSLEVSGEPRLHWEDIAGFNIEGKPMVRKISLKERIVNKYKEKRDALMKGAKWMEYRMLYDWALKIQQKREKIAAELRRMGENAQAEPVGSQGAEIKN